MPRFTVDDLARITSQRGYQEVAAPVAQLRSPEPKRDAQYAPLGEDEGKEKGTGRYLVSIVRCSTRLCDVDNVYGSCKWTVDGLRYAKLIPDDDPEAIELVIRQRKVRKGETGTEITITPL